MIIRRSKKDDIFGMANLNPNKTGLHVIIWSDHGGAYNNRHHNEPRIKIGTSEGSVSTTISPNPRILSKSKNIKKSLQSKIDEGIEYVGRNYDLCLKHFNDSDFSFDDEDLFQALRDRGEYK